MADKVQINPQLTARTRDLLKQACQQQGQSQGDVIEAALLAYLVPSAAESTLTRLVAEQAQLGGIVREMQATLGPLLAGLEGLAPPTPPSSAASSKVSIATYDAMYGPIVPAPTLSPSEVPDVPAPGVLRRWFSKEEHA